MKCQLLSSPYVKDWSSILNLSLWEEFRDFSLPFPFQKLKKFLKEASGPWYLQLYFFLWGTKEFKAQNSFSLGFATFWYSHACRASLPPACDAVEGAETSSGWKAMSFLPLEEKGTLPDWPRKARLRASLSLERKPASCICPCLFFGEDSQPVLILVSGPHQPRWKETLKQVA